MFIRFDFKYILLLGYGFSCCLEKIVIILVEVFLEIDF